MTERTDFYAWFFLPERDLCVAVPAKCGGTSFYRNALHVPSEVPSEHVRSAAVALTLPSGRGPFATFEVDKFFPETARVLAVRDPIERFMSLWRDLNRTRKTWIGSPEELALVVREDPAGDPHWAPQHWYLVPRARLVPHDVLPTVLGYEGCPHERRTKRCSDDPSPPVGLIQHLYGLDFDLHARVSHANP